MSLPLFPEPGEAGKPQGKRPIAVIGAGFSGTIATLQLLKRLPPDQPVLLCERSPDFARGMAYATGDNDHLLNVRAANMSALTDEPTHFQDWLKRRAAESGVAGEVHETEAGLFASRGLYGQYLRSILDYAMRQTAGHAQLRLLPDDVLDIATDEGGYELVWRQRSSPSGGRNRARGGQPARGRKRRSAHLPQRVGREDLAEALTRPSGADRRHQPDHGRHCHCPAGAAALPAAYWRSRAAACCPPATR